MLTSRQHLLNEAEPLLSALPLELRDQLPDSKAVRPRLAALARRNRRRRHDAPTTLRLRLLDAHHARIAQLDREEQAAVAQLQTLVRCSASTLGRALRPVDTVGRRAAGRGRRPAPLHRRILKRHLSDVVYRRMMRDLKAAEHAHPVAARPGGSRRADCAQRNP